MKSSPQNFVLFAAFAAGVSIPVSRAFLLPAHSRHLSENLPHIPAQKPFRDYPSLYYSTGNEPNKVVDEEQLSKLDAYKTVAELDPLWYEKFVVNVLGEKKSKEIGLPTLIPAATKSAGPKAIKEEKSMPESSASKESFRSVGNEPFEVDQATEDVRHFFEFSTELSEHKQENTIAEILENDENLFSISSNKTEISVIKENKALVDAEKKKQETEREEKGLGENNKGIDIANSNLSDGNEIAGTVFGIIQDKSGIISEDSIGQDQTQQDKELPSFQHLKVKQPKDLKDDQHLDDAWGNALSQAVSAEPPLSLGIVAEETAVARKSEGTEASLAESPLKIESSQPRKLSKNDILDNAWSETMGKIFSRSDSSEGVPPNKDFVGETKIAAGEKTLFVEPEVPVEDLVVVYKLDGESLAEPLATLINLGYTRQDVLALQSDAVDLIIADRTARPKAGLPRNWQISASDKRLLNDGDRVIVMPLAELEGGTRKTQLKAVDLDLSVPAVREQPPVKDVASPPKSPSESELPADAPMEESTPNMQYSSLRKGGDAIASDEVSKTTGTDDTKVEGTRGIDDGREGDKFKGDEVAVYRDPILKRMRVTPIKNLEVLGYSKDEVCTMRPDVLGTIASERRPRPRKGIPPHWRISQTERESTDYETVEIVLRADVDGYIKAQLHTRKREDDQSSPKSPSERPWKDRKERLLERSAYRADGQRKTVYHVHPQNSSMPRSMMQASNSKPKRKMWPDIDKFRDLLRTEAELRVRLTGEFGGEDFVDAIKEECDMRLGLYEGWLRTLDSGIGDPILPLVPPRSERYVVPPRTDDGSKRRLSRTRPKRKRKD